MARKPETYKNPMSNYCNELNSLHQTSRFLIQTHNNLLSQWKLFQVFEGVKKENKPSIQAAKTNRSYLAFELCNLVAVFWCLSLYEQPSRFHGHQASSPPRQWRPWPRASTLANPNGPVANLARVPTTSPSKCRLPGWENHCQGRN